MPRHTDSPLLDTPPENYITKYEAAPICGVAITAFVGSYWAWRQRLDLPEPARVQVGSTQTMFFDRSAVEEMAAALHKRGRKKSENGEWLDDCRKMRQMLQNVTEEQETNDPMLRLRNQILAAKTAGLSLNEFLRYDTEGLPLPMENFKKMQLLDVVMERRKPRWRGAADHVSERS